MRAATKQDLPVALADDTGVEVRAQEIGGGMTVGFFHLPQGTDLRPALTGLEDDLCQCPHWGYILAGRLAMHTVDGTEIYEPGQAVYWAPGHAPEALEDTDYVDFSPTDEINHVVAHIQGQG
ncbi:MAG TPA: hypothetical protein VEX39_11120 [Thermoleophilaceae bacterium]|nr:hypothetical protein [Thermoleophilaceae bacterium]